MAEYVLTPELAEKIARSCLGIFGRTPDDVQTVARALRERGIGLVDISRARCWIDERVYSGAQWRLRQAAEEIESLRTRITGLEALLVDAQAEVERLKAAKGAS